MDLPILVAVVAAGIALIVALVHVAGGSRHATLGDAAAGAARFAEDFPDAGIVRSFVTADGCDALLLLDDGDIGLVHAVGAMALTRRYERGAFAAMVELADDRSIRLRTGDMTLPPLTIRFADAHHRAEAMAALHLSAVPVSKAA